MRAAEHQIVGSNGGPSSQGGYSSGGMNYVRHLATIERLFNNRAKRVTNSKTSEMEVDSEDLPRASTTVEATLDLEIADMVAEWVWTT